MTQEPRTLADFQKEGGDEPVNAFHHISDVKENVTLDRVPINAKDAGRGKGSK